MTFQIWLDAWHRRDYDALIERHWRARVWMNEQRRARREAAPPIPPAIALSTEPRLHAV